MLGFRYRTLEQSYRHFFCYGFTGHLSTEPCTCANVLYLSVHFVPFLICIIASAYLPFLLLARNISNHCRCSVTSSRSQLLHFLYCLLVTPNLFGTFFCPDISWNSLYTVNCLLPPFPLRYHLLCIILKCYLQTNKLPLKNTGYFLSFSSSLWIWLCVKHVCSCSMFAQRFICYLKTLSAISFTSQFLDFSFSFFFLG